MTTMEITQQVAVIHNLIVKSVASDDPGEKAIATGDAIRCLRGLLKRLDEQVKAEKAEKSEDGSAGEKSAEHIKTP